jgi:Tfp pilus assembly protein PilV
MIMKSNGNYFHNRMTKQRRAGFALMDVVLAMAIFAFGMLALVQLQTSLARASADANVRTVAASVAEEMVERLRAYRSVIADPANDLVEFMEMDGTFLSDTVDIQVGGDPDGETLLQFTRTVTVTNFWWDDANDTFIRTDTMAQPAGVSRTYPNFKLLKLDVSWSNSDDFYVSDTATADLDSGEITIYEIVSSTPAAVGAQLATPLEQDTGAQATYTPGDNPDIVPLTLDGPNNKFKESSLPAPVVVNQGAVRETWFDVITYNGEGDI